jgi:hypothetical protein
MKKDLRFAICDLRFAILKQFNVPFIVHLYKANILTFNNSDGGEMRICGGGNATHPFR